MELEVNIELGLQTVNYHTLKKSIEDIPWRNLSTVSFVVKYNFQTTVHMILNLLKIVNKM